MQIFVEYGLDFDNNRFGLGRSVEIEYADGTEKRTMKKVRLKNKRCYFRMWTGKYVFILSHNGPELVRKKRWNFKIVFGIRGYMSEPDSK